MCRVILVCCVLISLFRGLNGDDWDNQNCSLVREHFKLIGDEDLVPEKPVQVENLRVCFSSRSDSEHSCCSHHSEEKYISAAKHYIKEYLHSRTHHLGEAVSKHITEYTDELTNIVKQAEGSLSRKLTAWYSIPHDEQQHALSALFTDIQDYVKHKNVLLESTINKFFDNIFPVIFKHVIYHQSTETWTHHYSHCLTNQRRVIRPTPFGRYPDDIVKKLTQGLSLMRTYLQALSVVVETVNTTNNLTWGNECIHAITRMKFCANCDGLVGMQPCYGLCYNVMNGCFARVAEIGRDWQDMMKLIETLVLQMSEKSIDKVFKELLVGISEAFMHAMITATDFYDQVHELCGVPYEGSDTEPRQGPTFNKGTAGNHPEIATFPFMSVMQITLQLVDSKRMFLNLGLDRCPKQPDDLSGEIECWNGTESAAYIEDMVNREIVDQARFNPEVKVSLTLDLELRRLKTNITETNFALQSHTRKTPKLKPSALQIADDPYVYEASGDGTVSISKGVTLVDDEDLNTYTSGSGSGDDSFDEILPTRPGDRFEVDFPKGNQDQNPPYIDGGKLGPDIPKRVDPPRQPNNQNRNPSGGATTTNLSVILLVSTVLLSLLWERR